MASKYSASLNKKMNDVYYNNNDYYYDVQYQKKIAREINAIKAARAKKKSVVAKPKPTPVPTEVGLVRQRVEDVCVIGREKISA